MPEFEPNDAEASIAAKVLKVMDRKNFYSPRKVRVENLPSMTPVATHEEGDVPNVVEAMVKDESFPVRWSDIGASVTLEVDSQRYTAASIRRLAPDVLEWDHKHRLGN